MEVSKRKLLLVPVMRGKKRLAPRELVQVRVNEDTGLMAMGRPALEAMCGLDKLYRVFFDAPNSVIAWQFKEGLNKDEMESKTWKPVNPSKQSGMFVVPVKRILEAMGRGGHGSYRAEVKKYLMKGDLMQDGDYFFVDLAEATSKPV